MNHCDICKLDLSTAYAYKRHLETKTHAQNVHMKENNIAKPESTKDRVFCEICQVDYASDHTYNKHLTRKEHTEKVYLLENNLTKEIPNNDCHICDVSFDKQHKLIRHQKTKMHIENEAYFKEHNKLKDKKDNTTDCDICDIQFQVPSAYQRHIATETHKLKVYNLENNISEVEKTKYCDICDLEFQRFWNYEQHLETNLHKRNVVFKEQNIKQNGLYCCEVCHKEYDSVYEYNRHVKTQTHEGNLVIDRDQTVAFTTTECIACEQTFTDQYSHDKHFTSVRHLNKTQSYENKLAREEKKKQLKLSTDYILYLDGNAIFLDKEVYEFIVDNDITIYIDKLYVRLTYKKYTLLHLFIFYHFYGNERDPKKPYVDHINRNSFDDRISNLRAVSYHDNARNRSKSENATSKYYGVHSHNNKWQCSVNIHGKIEHHTYAEETHAAYMRDILIKEGGLDHISPMNNLEEPKGFIRKYPHIKKHGLPKGVFVECKRYYYLGHKSTRYYCDTYEEAAKGRLAYEKKKKEDKHNFILSQPIKYDEKGVAIIDLFNRAKEKMGQVQVDDDLYYHLMMFKWYLNSYGYVSGTVDGKIWTMSRYIMNCTNPEMDVDHEDHNRLHNRKRNLREVTATQNAQNRIAVKGSTSQYVGVKANHGKWRASAKIDGISIISKQFDTELEAVKARDKAVFEYNKKHNTIFHINLPHELEIDTI